MSETVRGIGGVADTAPPPLCLKKGAVTIPKNLQRVCHPFYPPANSAEPTRRLQRVRPTYHMRLGNRKMLHPGLAADGEHKNGTAGRGVSVADLPRRVTARLVQRTWRQPRRRKPINKYF